MWSSNTQLCNVHYYSYVIFFSHFLIQPDDGCWMQPKYVAALDLLYKKLGIDESFVIRHFQSFKTLWWHCIQVPNTVQDRWAFNLYCTLTHSGAYNTTSTAAYEESKVCTVNRDRHWRVKLGRVNSSIPVL
jgi:hypothetical protein